SHLREDPWRLLALPDVKVVEADRLAVRTIPGVRRDDPRRGRALVAHALARAARDGHTTCPVELVHAALTADGLADPAAAVAAALDTGALRAVADGELALDRYAMAEDAIAEAVARLTATAKPLAEPADLDPGAGAGPDAGLDEAQRAAVVQLATAGVSVLT